MTRATDTPHSVKTRNGEVMESRQDILGCISDTLPKSLKTQRRKNGIGKGNRNQGRKQFKALSMRETESHGKEITKGIVKKAIQMMWNKRTPNRRGWRAAWIKNGGEEMESSLVKLFNRMERENTTPIQWK